MVLSYSAMARPAEDAQKTIDISSSSFQPPMAQAPVSPSSTPNPLPSASSSQSTNLNHLILDAGPLLALRPLRYLATTFHTTPLVLAELRDPKAREHWERLGLSGVDVKVETPNVESMAKVVAFAKKTGDYAVLSHTDLSVIALTYQYEVKENGEAHIRTAPGQKLPTRSPPQPIHGEAIPINEPKPSEEATVDETQPVEESESEDDQDGSQHDQVNEITESIEQVLSGSPPAEKLIPPKSPIPQASELMPTNPDTITTSTAVAAPESDESDDEGAWITPSNLSTHRSHDLGLLPEDAGSSKTPIIPLAAACMTGDYAVQNVLLGMGLGLVGEGGKRISKVKSFVLRCHACFKLCKDPSKKFCPSCGNPTLLRTTVSTSSTTGQQTIHLKKNFQYRLRGTKFSIPDPKMGRAKGQQKGGSGLVLREDQREWTDAVRVAEREREKEERRLGKGVLGGWNDPDWLPEIISVGMSGKGRSNGAGMPAIGHGRKNPNQARRKR